MAAVNVAGALPQDDVLNQRVSMFREFLASDYGEDGYSLEIRRTLDANKKRLVINIDHIREYNHELAEDIIRYPSEFIPAMERAVQEVIKTLTNGQVDPATGAALGLHVGFKGSFGEHHLNPRSLRATFIGKLVCLEGIVTRCSLVRPKVLRSVHYCEQTKGFLARDYRDATMLSADANDSLPSSTTYPTEDQDGNPLTTEYGLCVYMDHQTINIQEMPERAPPGQLPRSIDVILDDDLVDAVKPGDRVQLVGIYKSLGNRNAQSSSATFKTLVLCNTLHIITGKTGGVSGSSSNGIAQLNLTEADIRNINRIGKQRNAFELLSRSVAPSIYGHEYIKKAVLLLLLGGMEKNLANGTHIRGDINILMVGDPSTAKSQVLRYVLNIAPLAIATTGRGSSGVGLTAAVVTDKETGERRLEAGAMVLADRGIVCIDEFDKMSDVDRVAIHEVMEQQTVTIAKAGIHTTLNARCSVVAAANPIYGQYDESKEPHRNIALPDSLLSRFDLLFVVLDHMDEARDRTISSHVLRMHRYVPPSVEEGMPIPDVLDQNLQMEDEQDAEALQDTPVFEKQHRFLNAARSVGRGARGRAAGANEETLTTAFLKKFLFYAKNRIQPVLTKPAADIIAEAYAELRNDKQTEARKKTLPVTARTLETLIRLATAHAKARLSTRVEETDALSAKSLLRFALYKETALPGAQAAEENDAPIDSSKPQAKRRRVAKATGKPVAHDADSDSDNPDAMDQTTPAAPRRSQRSTGQSAAGARDTGAEAGPGRATQVDGAAMEVDAANTALDAARLALFRGQLQKQIANHHLDDGSLPLELLLPLINSDLQEGAQDDQKRAFATLEAEAALEEMQKENQVMYSGGLVVLI
ncbi:MCM DNA helicase complex subunit [Tieghemiomyces parasiticus]|uniref:DNA replication licensing factor MCM3 n=1 Tax=Tieghemiomyces parasiticus TaxID=78921 RepID=A0A9W7ZQH1_9FUNG|nr:MCM DNA helicase complex subunit [Tieghemiomyces parasiticus]